MDYFLIIFHEKNDAFQRVLARLKQVYNGKKIDVNIKVVLTREGS